MLAMRMMRVALRFAAVVLLTTLSASVLAMEAAGDEGGHVPRDIERGRYLVKIAGCNDCHTQDYALKAGAVNESKWLAGNDVGWQGPWGTTYPSNLRLLAQGLTRDQWLANARRPMRPPMPWFSLRDMSDEDLTAIYFFVRSLGPGGSPAPAYEPPRQPVVASNVKRWRAE
jgi:mono/diheme cytochrome c family protein